MKMQGYIEIRYGGNVLYIHYNTETEKFDVVQGDDEVLKSYAHFGSAMLEVREIIEKHGLLKSYFEKD